MPFTLSHPAAAALLWPAIRRGHLPMASVVIGALSPDLEYFLRLRPISVWSHTLTGLVLFCLPVGMAFLAAWEFVMRDPVRRLFGLSPRASRRTDAWWWKAVVGVLTGAATHLAWDGMTHDGFWGTAVAPSLRELVPVAGRRVPLFNVLQHASTLLGGVIVLGWLAGELRRAGALPVLARPGWRWVVFGAVTVLSLLAGWINGTRGVAPVGYWGVQLWLGRVAVGSMVACSATLLVYSIVCRGRREN